MEHLDLALGTPQTELGGWQVPSGCHSPTVQPQLLLLTPFPHILLPTGVLKDGFGMDLGVMQGRFINAQGGDPREHPSISTDPKG